METATNEPKRTFLLLRLRTFNVTRQLTTQHSTVTRATLGNRKSWCSGQRRGAKRGPKNAINMIAKHAANADSHFLHFYDAKNNQQQKEEEEK